MIRKTAAFVKRERALGHRFSSFGEKFRFSKDGPAEVLMDLLAAERGSIVVEVTAPPIEFLLDVFSVFRAKEQGMRLFVLFLRFG